MLSKFCFYFPLSRNTSLWNKYFFMYFFSTFIHKEIKKPQCVNYFKTKAFCGNYTNTVTSNSCKYPKLIVLEQNQQ